MAIASPWAPPTASAHGSVEDPLSRVYGCMLRWEYNWQDPIVEEQDPMCWAAWQANPNAMWGWSGLYREGTGGDFQAYIPDNQLCSAGHVWNSEFAAMDTPGPWLTTEVAEDFTVDVYDLARHGADYLQVYVTEQGYDAQTDALDWDDLELVAETGRYEPSDHYTVDVSAPGRSGHHVVYTIWKASHHDQIYFMCSDVTF
ncbi:lytic polysaccharide monooxygenase [Streptomyces sp. DSM 44915]|uniref:Lytic polysaccharide monooxygenase n=2 Tax=Streptomyces chisholmiae TaxID=3075540 RepID=A0ABU2JUG1_9ACTN|nr:lytic polysaccharide monooxygenase [Streptomyces sp. DSM 44915]MDT0268636.1 lytic polysaccharide monooxygenase [Streptomyces sp. DSM 44915]